MKESCYFSYSVVITTDFTLQKGYTIKNEPSAVVIAEPAAPLSAQGVRFIFNQPFTPSQVRPIGYEGQDYELTAGQSFRFDKNGLHSVTAQGKFKMSLLLVLE